MIHTQGFADDVTPIATSIDSVVAAARMQAALDWLQNWAERHSLKFCQSKCTVVMFTWQRKAVSAPLFLCGEPLTYHKRAKYLGVTLDSRLSWTPHVPAVTKKAKTCLAQCRRAVAVTWGISPSSMKWMYTAAIRPIIESCVVWSPALELKCVREALTKVSTIAIGCLTQWKYSVFHRTSVRMSSAI